MAKKKTSKKGAKSAPKKKYGRPTKYKEEYIQACYEFFDRELYTDYAREVPTRDGVTTIIEREPNRIPTIEGFALELMVNKTTLYEWAKHHKEFSNALNYGRQKQKEFLNFHSLMGNYNAAYAKFFAINATDMVEKKEVEHSGNSISISYNKVSNEEN